MRSTGGVGGVVWWTGGLYTINHIPLPPPPTPPPPPRDILGLAISLITKISYELGSNNIKVREGGGSVLSLTSFIYHVVISTMKIICVI
jgi:hypothetical protein